MIQHGNMMQLLLWHALSTLKDSLKEKAGRFPFPACCWAWSGRQWPESTPDCWWLWHLPNAHKHGEVLHSIYSMISMFYWHLLTPFAQSSGPGSLGDILSFQRDERHEGSIAFQLAPESFSSFPSWQSKDQWHHVTPTHTQRSQRQKKRNSSGPSAGPWDLVACPDIVAARASPDTEQKDIGTSCYILNILKHPEMLQRTCIVCITEYHWISGCCRPMLPSHCALLAFHTSRTKAFRRMVATL